MTRKTPYIVRLMPYAFGYTLLLVLLQCFALPGLSYRQVFGPTLTLMLLGVISMVLRAAGVRKSKVVPVAPEKQKPSQPPRLS